MKGIQINPYNLVAIYAADTEASLQGFLYSPTKRLPPMQFYIPGAASRVDEWELVNIESGAVFAQDDGLWGAESDGTGQWLTYFGGLLDNPPPEGKYRARIVRRNGQVYWSHALCLTAIFDDAAAIGAALTLSVESCGQTNGYEFDMESGGAWVEIFLNDIPFKTETANFKIKALAAPPRTDVWRIRVHAGLEDSNSGGVDVYQDYLLTVTNPALACTNYTFAADGSPVGGQVEELYRLEWRNTKDVQSQRLLYQEQTGGDMYTQKMYLKAWRAFPVPVLENEFLVGSDGSQVLRSATVAEQLLLENWPVPDYAFTVLANAGLHQDIKLFNLTGEETALDAFEFTVKQIGTSDQAAGVFGCTVHRRYVSGCEEDFEI
jgi:hypothetical protein